MIPYLESLGRCIAPALIGMGESDKLPDSGPAAYSFFDHRRYLDGLFGALGLERLDRRVTFVVHDWGSALAFDWAHRHPEAVKGIAYMEAIVQPLTWDQWPERGRSLFQGFRSPAGEELILERNLFVEAVLPRSVLRQLTEEEMAEYRRPFAEPGESRRPTLSWPRQIPIDGEPASVVDVVRAYADWLATSAIPKLFINAEPGAILTANSVTSAARGPTRPK